MKRLLILLLVAACRSNPPAAPPAWHDETGYRWRALEIPRTGLSPGFTSLAPSQTGISFSNTVSDSLLVHNRQLAQGAGVCLADVDGDGRPDVFLARTEGPSALYRNLGDWRFEDITQQAGVAAPDRHATGCAFADVDGDGDQDLLLVSLGGPNALFINDGKGHFTEQTAGLTDKAGSMSIALADVDGDGDLDLYVANNKAYTTIDRIPPQERGFDRITRKLGPNRYEVREPYRKDYKVLNRADLGGFSLVQRADPDFFYLNDGTGHFVREPMAHNPRFVDENGKPLSEEREDFGLAAVFVDLNGDGAPDLYVANDFEDPDQYWINDGHGHFRLIPWYALRATSNSGMAVAVGDVNRDGYPDLFEVDMLSKDTRRLKTQIPTHTTVAKQPGIGDDRPQMQRNTLQLNRGDGTFAEVARFAGVSGSGWSWSTVFLDVDLDGWEDILIGTGHVSDVMDGDTQYRLRNALSGYFGGAVQGMDWRRMLFDYPSLKLPNVAFRNRGDLTFEDVSKKWRFDLGDDISHGMALADLDGDGDLDVVINRLDQPAAVLRNDATAPRVAVRLRGAAPNTAGIGSRVRVLGGPVPLQQREMVAGGLYLSSSDASLTFATGTAAHVRIEVEWRDGARSVIDSATPNREYEIAEPGIFADHLFMGVGDALSTIRGRPLVLFSLLAAACGRSGSPTDTSWHQAGGYRWRSLIVPSRRMTPGFTLLDPSKTGIAFTNTVSESLLARNRILADGAGVCLADVDGDGRPDVFLVRTEGPSALYRNLGDWRFEDITAQAGVAAPARYATGCAFADVDGDGDQDLLLVSLGGPNTLFLNDGKGHFTERESGLESTAGSKTLALADVDGDGDLDLYVTNYKAYTMLDRLAPGERSFDNVTRRVGNGYEVREQYRHDYRVVDRPDLGGFSLEQRADPDFFYRNDGTGHFVRESIAHNPRFTDEHGKRLTAEPENFGLAATFADLNGDGAPDLYVVNDFEDPDLFWLNDGHGNFRLAPWYSVRATSNAGMGVAVGDVNRDGLPDLFEVDMLSRDSRRRKTQVPTHAPPAKQPGLGQIRPQMQRNTLQLNRGDGTFAEVARFAGVGRSGWSWSTVFLDVDLDGWEDILIGTGHVWDVMDGDTQQRLRRHLTQIDWRRILAEYPPLRLPNVAFRNRGDLTFEDVSKKWRFDIGEGISHGMALADLDGDGDLDVVINRLGQPAAVLRNDATAPRISVRLRGAAPNTAGIGSKVRVLGGPVPLQEREMIAGGLYLSSSDASLTFATGAAAHVRIEVDWRDGAWSVIDSATPNREYEIAEPRDAHAARRTPRAVSQPLFEDITAQLGGHQHVEPYFDDYQRQPLLPNSFSQLGPGIAWVDLDGDGKEDLIVGAGRTGSIAFFHNTGTRLQPSGVHAPPAPGDLTTILGWPDGRGGSLALAGVAAYEAGSTTAARQMPSVVAYSPRTGAVTPLIGGDTASVGPLALADYDGDGTLDLFVGARIYPAGYPLSPSSRLYHNVDGRLVLDTANSRLFAQLGMVSAALFSDIDGDGYPDLLVAIEWGTIRVFLNDHGRFRPAEFPGLSGVYSRWNGLATGDLDGDGRLDIVATSWGRNTDYPATDASPLLLYTGFFTGRGRPDILLAQHDPRIGAVAPLPNFDRLAMAMPGAAQRLQTYSAYADADIDHVLGPAGAQAVRLAATTLDQMVFLNRGDRFEAHALPAEAQLTPAFYAGVADFNGDGKEDLFLSQNFFATDVATPRYDAGRSLLLFGDGTGGFEAVPGQRSGLLVYGEQRGAAYADFDGDGRLDLAVSQNGAATRLFHNVGATPGLRVRIVGAVGNPTGIGTQMRLRYGEAAGPVREIQAGSGYWSQNGGVQVLGRAGEPTALWLRWPGGREQVVPLAPGQREITVRAPK